MKAINLIILCLFIWFNCAARDTTRISNHRIGISASTGIINDDILFDDFHWEDLSKYNYGYDLRLGIFYEKRLGKRLILATEVGLGYSNFTSDFKKTNRNNWRYGHYYKSDWKMLYVASIINLKFYYLKKKRLYVEMGIGLDLRLNDIPKMKYQVSTIHRSMGPEEIYLQEGKDRENEITNFVLLTSRYPRFNFGLGFKAKHFDFGFFFKFSLTHHMSIRVRYPFLNEE